MQRDGGDACCGSYLACLKSQCSNRAPRTSAWERRPSTFGPRESAWFVESAGYEQSAAFRQVEDVAMPVEHGHVLRHAFRSCFSC